jgi:hypothetical protein
MDFEVFALIKEYINHMIHPYDNSTQTRWDRGEFKVQLNPRPGVGPQQLIDMERIIANSAL